MVHWFIHIKSKFRRRGIHDPIWRPPIENELVQASTKPSSLSLLECPVPTINVHAGSNAQRRWAELFTAELTNNNLPLRWRPPCSVEVKRGTVVMINRHWRQIRAYVWT